MLPGNGQDPRPARIHILAARLRIGRPPPKTLEDAVRNSASRATRVRQIQNIALRKLRKMIEKMEGHESLASTFTFHAPRNPQHTSRFHASRITHHASTFPNPSTLTPMPSATAAEIESAIRNIPDFPKSGIQFKDITRWLADGAALFRQH